MKLTLHEAIAIVLLGKEHRMAHIQEIADEINRRGLYAQRDGSALPTHQVRMRTKFSNGRYSHLFSYLDDDFVQLKNLTL